MFDVIISDLQTLFFSQQTEIHSQHSDEIYFFKYCDFIVL